MDLGAIIGALARHAGSAIGVWLAANGFINGSDQEMVIGAVVGVAMVVWSIISKLYFSPPTISGGVKSIAAALLITGLGVSLMACTTLPDGTVVLNPSARAKLETASKWAHRGSTTAHVIVIGITSSCSGKTSAFCNKAMPLVALVDGALTVFDKALAAGDKALADGSASDAALGQALADLIETEKAVEDYIASIKTQTSALPTDFVWPTDG